MRWSRVGRTLSGPPMNGGPHKARPTWILLASLLVGAVAVAQSRAADQTAPELAQALQRRYDAIRDFSADFVHTYQGGVLRKRLTERGRMLIKKPGKMRWDYSAPEQKQFVSDGVKIYSYLPEDKQVFVGSVPREDEATTPTLFLTGKGNLTRDFTSSSTDPPGGVPPGSRALKRVPRAPERDYDWIILAFDPAAFMI